MVFVSPTRGSSSDTSLDFHVGFNTRGREIISHNGGPHGCAEVVLPANGDLPFGQLANISFNHTINTNLTLVWISLTNLPLKTKTKVKPPTTLTETTKANQTHTYPL